MKNFKLSIILLFFSGLIIGCSDVEFAAIPSQTCLDANKAKDQSCKIGKNGNEYSVTFKTGQIDILFIDDNSGSMSPEQAKMADAFSGFLNNIDHLDYQIGITTTDIARTDGQLLEFTDQSGNKSGKYIISKDNGSFNQNDELFKGTIKRQETLDCDQSGYSPASCPAMDERGIYAMNRAVERNEKKLLRNGAHLAIVVLSDEDQRSKTECTGAGCNTLDYSQHNWEGAFAYAGYKLADRDRPETLVETFKNKFTSKTMSVHSVILKPGDSSCKSVQDQGNLKGYYGNLYYILSYPEAYGLSDDGRVVNGSSASICNSTYYNNLNFAASIAAANANKQIVQMKCLPDAADIEVESSQNVNYTINSADKTLIFNNLPIGISVTVKYKCPNSV